MDMAVGRILLPDGRVDGCSTDFQVPSIDSQRWWVTLVPYGQLNITQHFEENHHGIETALHHTTVGGGCCRGRDRRRTDGVRNRSAVLQREWLPDRPPLPPGPDGRARLSRGPPP